eukprot:3099391-Rhodomonas_salina.7
MARPPAERRKRAAFGVAIGTLASYFYTQAANARALLACMVLFSALTSDMPCLSSRRLCAHATPWQRVDRGVGQSNSIARATDCNPQDGRSHGQLRRKLRGAVHITQGGVYRVCLHIPVSRSWMLCE